MGQKTKKIKINFGKELVNILFIVFGGIVAGYALEGVLIPNQVSDGGVTGISIMISHVTGMSLGMLIVLLNIPFIYLGYKQVGKTFAIKSVIGIVVLAVSTTLMHHVPTILEGESWLVTITGGILLGIGIGLSLRNGGALDGTEMLAVLVAKKVPFNVGEIIMMINSVIFAFATLVFGLEGAIASAVTYFIASKVIHIIEIGLDDSKDVRIICSEPQELGQLIQDELGRSVTYSKGIGGYKNQDLLIINCVINRMEESKMKTIINSVDPNAFVTFSDVSEVKGGRFKKKDIH